MTGGPVLIDLGDVPRLASRERAEPPRRRRWSARQNWPLVAVVLLVLVVSTATAAGRGSELVLVTTLSAAGSNFTVHGDSLYVAPRGRGGGGGPLIAYRLADGVPRWTLPAEDGPFFGVRVVAGQLLAISGSCQRLSGSEFAALDPATGTIRWRHFGQLIGRGAPGLLLVDVRPAPWQCGGPVPVGEEPPDDPGPTTIQAVDLATGETRWAIRPPPDAELGYLTENGVLRELVFVDQRGQAQAVDAATGRVLASGQVSAVLDPRSGGRLVVQWHAFVVGRLLVIGIRDGGELTMTAYSVDTFSPVWSRPVDLRLRPTSSYTPLWDLTCGSLICLQSSNGIIAVDGRSGEVRWRMADAGPLWSSDSVLLVGAGGPRGGPGAPVLRLVDPQTGETRIRVSGYDLRGVGAAERNRFVLGAHEAGSTMFVLLDADRRQRRFLGRAAGGYERCEATDRYLVCTSGVDTMRVWRISG